MDFLSLRKQWRRRKNARISNRVGKRKRMQIERFGGGKRKRGWRIRSIPKLRLKLSSPLKLWNKFKNAYTNMMLNLAGNVGALSGGSGFAGSRITTAPPVPLPYNGREFENRLIYEVYKSLVVSMELNST